MIDRIAKKTLLRLSGQFPVVGITGPRQSGKTTLTKETFPQKQYISFDDKNMREIATSNPSDFLRAFPDGLIIDEAQKVPDIFDAIKLTVDKEQSPPGKFILTGSSQFRLKKNMSDSLSGRAAFLSLLPFAIQELKNADLLPDDPYEFILKGQYPPLYDKNKHFIPDDWFEAYIDTYLSRDVKGKINDSNMSTFRKFIQVCAVYSGHMLSMDSIAKNVGITAPTVKNWLSILEQSYIIHFLEPDTNNLGHALVKTPKLYFVDTGLLCHLLRMESTKDLLLDRMKGAVVETFAVSELLKARSNIAKKANITYFRDQKGFEVDIIADWKKTFALEIKSSADTEAIMSSNLRKYLKMRQETQTKGSILYLGDISATINNIDYVSWKDWGSFFSSK